MGGPNLTIKLIVCSVFNRQQTCQTWCWLLNYTFQLVKVRMADLEEDGISEKTKK